MHQSKKMHLCDMVHLTTNLNAIAYNTSAHAMYVPEMPEKKNRSRVYRNACIVYQRIAEQYATDNSCIKCNNCVS
jgi:hypothetical protein